MDIHSNSRRSTTTSSSDAPKQRKKRVAKSASAKTTTRKKAKKPSASEQELVALGDALLSVGNALHQDEGLVGNIEFDEDELAQIPAVTEFILALNQSRSGVRKALVSLVLNSIKTVSSLTEASQGVDEIYTKSASLADYSATIASASEELSSTIQSISHNLENTVQASSQARSFAADGDEVIDSTLHQIQEAHGSMAETNDALTVLLNTAEQANTIIQVVNDISSKTDLLALNASIEAARAGAAGRGFAVVAHEVGRLSEKTQSSISEIESIIKNIKTSIGQVSDKIKSGTSSATAALEKVTHAKTTIGGIVERIENVDREVANIGSAVKEQGQAVMDIASNISTISASSREVKMEVEKLSESTDRIARLSNDSRNSLGKFSLGPKAIIQNAKIDHLFWMHRLRRMIAGKEVIRNEEFTDHTDCRLGKWYLSVSVDGYNAEFGRIFSKLDTPHADLHRLAADVIRRTNSGDPDGAFDTYQQCLPISESIMNLLEELSIQL